MMKRLILLSFILSTGLANAAPQPAGLEFGIALSGAIITRSNGDVFRIENGTTFSGYRGVNKEYTGHWFMDKNRFCTEVATKKECFEVAKQDNKFFWKSVEYAKSAWEPLSLTY